MFEKLLKVRVKSGRREYLVKWVGYPASANSWEPVNNIPGSSVVLFEQTAAEATVRQRAGKRTHTPHLGGEPAVKEKKAKNAMLGIKVLEASSGESRYQVRKYFGVPQTLVFNQTFDDLATAEATRDRVFFKLKTREAIEAEFGAIDEKKERNPEMVGIKVLEASSGESRYQVRKQSRYQVRKYFGVPRTLVFDQTFDDLATAEATRDRVFFVLKTREAIEAEFGADAKKASKEVRKEEQAALAAKIEAVDAATDTVAVADCVARICKAARSGNSGTSAHFAIAKSAGCHGDNTGSCFNVIDEQGRVYSTGPRDDGLVMAMARIVRGSSEAPKYRKWEHESGAAKHPSILFAWQVDGPDAGTALSKATATFNAAAIGVDAIAEASLRGLRDFLRPISAFIAAQRRGGSGPGPFVAFDMSLAKNGAAVRFQPGTILLLNYNRWATDNSELTMTAEECRSDPVYDEELIKLLKTSVNSSCCRLHVYLPGDRMSRHADGRGISSADHTKLTLIRSLAAKPLPLLERFRAAVEGEAASMAPPPARATPPRLRLAPASVSASTPAPAKRIPTSSSRHLMLTVMELVQLQRQAVALRQMQKAQAARAAKA
jgi:hypothetical protein